jgi:hypothetical protein
MALRLVILIAVASIGVVVAPTRALAQHPSGRSDREIDASLAWSDSRRGLVVADPNTGRTSVLRPSGSWCGSCGFIRVGRTLYGADGSHLYALDLRSRHARIVAPVSGIRVFAAATTGAIYVAGPATAIGGESLALIAVDGTNLGGPWRVPDGHTLTTPPKSVFDGVLVETTANAFRRELAVWQPETDELESLGSVWTTIDTVSPAHTGTSMVARLDCVDFPCPLLLTDLTSRANRQTDAPASSSGFFGGGAFSPDAEQLATFISTSHPPTVDPAVELGLVDVTTGALHVVKRSHVPVGEPYGWAGWSPSGRWLIFGGLSDRFLAYRVGDSRAHRLPHLRGAPYSPVVLPRLPAR